MAQRPSYFSIARVIGIKYMWEHKGDLPFCSASNSGKLERWQEGTLTSASFAPQGLSVASLSPCCPDDEQQAVLHQI